MKRVPARQTSYQLDLSGLNPEQREAVLHDSGPLLVLAGAGSGKTRVITFRIARLLRDGVPADRILGVTFTNKAANEMRSRLRSIAGRPSNKVHLSTFHALGLAILREEYAAAGLSQGFCIYDTADQIGLVRELMRQTQVADRRLDAQKVLGIILKTKRERLNEVSIDWGDDYELAALDLYPRYLAQMRAFNAIDFDDLLLLALDVLQQPAVHRRWSRRFDFLLVDEYQDTSPDQLELVRTLGGEKSNVCVVGDDDQAIYAWRGAAMGNILSFGKHFPGTKEIILAQNYRSTGYILSAANSVIKNNKERKEKVLWSALGSGEPVEIVKCADGDDEAAFVSERIGQLVYEGEAYRDIAVLYRANAQSRAFEEMLALDHIPYRVLGGQAFFDRKEVRDATAYLSVAINPRDEISLRRIINVPPRGIGPTSLEKLAAHGERTGKGLWHALQHIEQIDGMPQAALAGARQLLDILQPMSQALREAKPGEGAVQARELFERLGMRDAILQSNDAPAIARRRLDNLEEVVSGLARFEERMQGSGSPVEEYLRGAVLSRRPAEDEDEGLDNQVTLMTLHSAKGLEFPYVFLVGVEEDLLPHKRSVEMGGEISEERRLCYVGITRARQRLWITYADVRRKYGKPEQRSPSRFLQEIPEGDGVLRWSRQEGRSEEESDAMAEDFFRKMRAQLGMEEEGD